MGLILTLVILFSLRKEKTMMEGPSSPIEIFESPIRWLAKSGEVLRMKKKTKKKEIVREGEFDIEVLFSI